MTDHDRPEEIEARIHETQGELRRDLEALEEKLSPENLKAEAWDRVGEAKDLVQDKAVESTRQAGEAVRERIDDVAQRLFEGDGRLPSLSLLGLAVVIGLGLLIVRGEQHEVREEQRYDRLGSERASRHVPPRSVASRPHVR